MSIYFQIQPFSCLFTICGFFKIFIKVLFLFQDSFDGNLTNAWPSLLGQECHELLEVLGHKCPNNMDNVGPGLPQQCGQCGATSAPTMWTIVETLGPLVPQLLKLWGRECPSCEDFEATSTPVVETLGPRVPQLGKLWGHECPSCEDLGATSAPTLWQQMAFAQSVVRSNRMSSKPKLI